MSNEPMIEFVISCQPKSFDSSKLMEQDSGVHQKCIARLFIYNSFNYVMMVTINYLHGGVHNIIITSNGNIDKAFLPYLENEHFEYLLSKYPPFQ